MTREEQLDALMREALKKLGELPCLMDRSRRDGITYGPIYAFDQWLRLEFLRTQGP